MLQTKVTQMLGIAYPLLGGAMMWISKPEFVSAVSNAGGLGILASAMYPTREDFKAAIEKTLDLTDKPFAVNLNLFPVRRPVDNIEYFDEGIISCGQGIGLVHDVPTVKELFDSIIAEAAEIVKGF